MYAGLRQKIVGGISDGKTTGNRSEAVLKTGSGLIFRNLYQMW